MHANPPIASPGRAGSTVAALVLLSGLLVLRWWAEIAAPEPRRDERFYLAAFELVLEGRSPFEEPRYYYPAVLARAGAWSLERAGLPATLAALRAANLLGIAGTLWIAVSGLSLPWRRRLLLAAALAMVLPAVEAAAESGNLSAAVSGLILAGLAAWPRRPLAAGGLLGLSVGIKPLAPVAILALLAHRPAAGGRRHLLAGAAAVALAGLLLLAVPGLGALLGQEVERVTATRIVSLGRALGALGLSLHPAALALLVAGGTVAVTRRRAWGPVELSNLAVAAAVLAAPVLWRHTLLVTLPLQLAAVALAISRLEAAWPRRSAEPPSAELGRIDPRTRRRLRLYELLLVLAAVAALQFAHGGGIDDRAPLLQALLLAVPTLAPAALLVYLYRTRNPGA